MSTPPSDSRTPQAAMVNHNQRATLAVPTIVPSCVAVVTHAKATSAASTVAVCAETHDCRVDHDSDHDSALYNDEAMIDDDIEDEIGGGKQDLANCKRTLFDRANEAAHQQRSKFPRLTGDETMLEDGSFTSVSMNGYSWASNSTNASVAGPPSHGARILDAVDMFGAATATADSPKSNGMGTRVRSADGWILVYPGDYVTHKEYGVGCVVPYTLSSYERVSQRQRRADILSAACKDHAKSNGRVMTPQELEQFRSKFGTEQDTDPISNPQAAFLQVVYNCGYEIRKPAKEFYLFQTAGASAEPPTLTTLRKEKNKILPGARWTKTMEQAEEVMMAHAQEVLALYSTREMATRTPFDRTVEPLVEEFEASFGHEPTRDQQRCFDDVKTDMIDSNLPMDRLVCGDVGFGKTEVAIRALYRCVVNGKQAAFLVPTSVLANQHHKTIVNRMGPKTKYNLSIGLLRRGMGKKTTEGREMREGLRLGHIKLIVGTHALLCDSLFQDLGLLVVDEEQRFGVKQKEELKRHFNGVDVLTLSATPIPRTLQMSLRGIRATSAIRTPPAHHQPVTPRVEEFSKDLVEQIIQAELDRQGQCYYVVPRTDMFDDTEKMIRELFPAIRIIRAHGKMKNHGAAQNLAAFAAGGFDVLLTTTLIEVGVDIANANTIIVQDSQNLGLNSLYQLKGRVGRSTKQGHAYLLKEKETSNNAGRRLVAIQESRNGVEAAQRDLEIRGSGMLFGTMQSGTLSANLGFDLFTRMQNKYLRRLQEMDLQPVLHTKVLLPVDGLSGTFRLPESYVTSYNDRLDEESKARLAPNTASLVALADTWKDKYGPFPDEVQKQLDVLYLHSCIKQLGIDLVGFVMREGNNNVVDGMADCIFRAPGLRPRHWATLLAELPNKMPPHGVNVVFPARFSPSQADLHVVGGIPFDLKLLRPDFADDDAEEEYWDAQDAIEADFMASSVEIGDSMTEALDSMDQYPRLIVSNLDPMAGNGIADSTSMVQRLLGLLMPIANIVHDKQVAQASKARAAIAMREQQESFQETDEASDEEEE